MQLIPVIIHTHDRRLLIDHLIDLRRLFPRQIDAAMGTAVNNRWFLQNYDLQEASCSPIPPLNGIQ